MCLKRIKKKKTTSFVQCTLCPLTDIEGHTFHKKSLTSNLVAWGKSAGTVIVQKLTAAESQKEAVTCLGQAKIHIIIAEEENTFSLCEIFTLELIHSKMDEVVTELEAGSTLISAVLLSWSAVVEWAVCLLHLVLISSFFIEHAELAFD